MARSRENHDLATSTLTGLLVFAILITQSVWLPSSKHLPYWLVGLIGGVSSLLARGLVTIATSSRT